MDAFSPDSEGLERAMRLLAEPDAGSKVVLPALVPVDGIGTDGALSALAPIVLEGARDLGAAGFFAHMDPPTPWITWAVSQWTASRNQNLLHPDTSPSARELESTVVGWLAPLFGMDGGHMTPGSTVANLTAIWAAREAGAQEVVASASSHLSIRKAAHLLGMPYRTVSWEDSGDLADAVAVVTAGATSTGEVEALNAAGDARWRHIDAAWSGPLRLSSSHSHLLDGIETSHSVSVSAHKWLFQPKESALVFFADATAAHESISVDGAYLAVPNVGVLGSHGSVAAPLAATLLAYGAQGIAGWIDQCMALADDLYARIDAHPRLEARTEPQSGVVNWRRNDQSVEATVSLLAPGVFVSTTTIEGETWLRSVAANPMADPDLVVRTVADA